MLRKKRRYVIKLRLDVGNSLIAFMSNEQKALVRDWSLRVDKTGWRGWVWWGRSVV